MLKLIEKEKEPVLFETLKKIEKFKKIKNSITIDKYLKQQEKTLYLKRGFLLQSVIKCNRELYSYKHPTQKPIKLMRILVKLVSKENDLILDPFCGSGSTGLACVMENRKFLGFEIDKEYFKIAQSRIKELSLSKSLFDKL